MLELCRAIIVAATTFDSHLLADLAARAGFGDVASIHDGQDGNGLRYPVSFFLLHHRLTDTDSADIIDAVRSIDRADLRYSPIIAAVGEGTSELVRKFVRMGFDDVISTDQSLVQLTARLGSHLDREVSYFETGNYLGPDRRRLDAQNSAHRPDTVSPHTRLVIHRDPAYGTRVLSRQMRGPQHAPALPPAPTHVAPPDVAATAAPRTFGKRVQPPAMTIDA